MPDTVAVDLDGTLTDAPFVRAEPIPPPSKAGRQLLVDLTRAGYQVVIHSGRISEGDGPDGWRAAVREIQAWLETHGLDQLVHRIWPWPKPSGLAFVDDRAIPWRGASSVELVKEIPQAARRGKQPSILILSPLSDRYSGVGNFAFPAIGVWRLAANCRAAGVRADIWDCNTGEEVPPSDEPEALIHSFLAKIEAEHNLADYDWVGFSILNDTLPLTLGLANLIRKKYPGVHLVAGNAEATLNYQDVLDKAPFEACLVGEADDSLPRLVMGEDPRRIKGVIWFNRGRRMTPEEFNSYYDTMDFGHMPLREYALKTAALYRIGDFVRAWIDDRRVDYGLIPSDIDPKFALDTLYSCCTVRAVTMDHCPLPCTYCLPADSMLDVGGGVGMPIGEIVHDKVYPVIRQHDGTFGRVVRHYEREYDGDMVSLRVLSAGKPIRLTPDHMVRLATGRSVPACDVIVGDRVRLWFEDRQMVLPVPVMETSVTHFSGTVYNVEVTPHHTYLADGLAVDNCSTARIPDFATGKYQNATFMKIDSVKALFLKIKREVPWTCAIYDDSDETFLGTRRGLEYAKALSEIKAEMDRNTPRGFRFLVQTRSNEMTRELVQNLAAAGVEHLTFGVENASQYVRDSLRKRQDDQKIIDIVDWCHEFGVQCYLLMILFPPETRLEDLDINVRVVRDWVKRGAKVSVEPYLMPYRGTPILDDPRYTYEHVAYEVPFSGPPAKRLKWPTLIWPRDPQVRSLMLYFRETLDAKIQAAKKAAGHNHTFKGFAGIVIIEHLAECLALWRAGKIAAWDGQETGEARRSTVYQEYADQESGADVRERARTTMQGTRFNTTHAAFDSAAVDGKVAGLKQGAVKARMEKDPAAPGEIILGGG